MQKAKHRTKIVSAPVQSQNGNGFHKRPRMPGNPVEEHSLYSAMGAFKDDPTWDEFVQIMKDERQKELDRDLRSLEEEEQRVHSGQ